MARAAELTGSAARLRGGKRETISHEDLLLRVTFVVSDPGDAGPCPVPVGAHEVFVYVRKGVLGVTVDEEAHELRTGDSLDANSAETIQYRALGRGRAVALWASVAELDGRRRRAAR
ncbi:MAG: cupin domain-containing protein [Gaiellaceae bacterium]